MWAVRINECLGTPWSEELDGKELHGTAWWRVRSGAEIVGFFPVHEVNTALLNIYKCGIVLVLKVAVFLHDRLYC